MSHRLNPLSIVTAAALVLAAPAARAQDEDPVAKITQMNRDAIDAYQHKKFEDARKILKQALDLASSSGLDQHPIKARTHVHMGIVIIGGFKQRDVGIKQFRKALEVQADISLTKGLVTPELQAAFDEAKSGGGAAAAAPAGPAGGGASAAPPAGSAAAVPEIPSNGLVHEAVTDGKQGSAISITVGVQSDLKFDKLVLAYRPEGASEFLGRAMKQVSEGTYSAEIPTTATNGNYVAYYIEADTADGAPVAARGSAETPLSIALSGGRSGAAAVARKSSDEEEEEEDDEEGGSKLFVGILGGSGMGWATGNGDTNADAEIKPAGMAWGVVQFAPEVGYWWKPNLMLSLQARLQFISGTTDIHTGPTNNETVYHTASYAAAAFVKATWRFGAPGGFRPFFSLAAGGGQIRHVVTFKSFKDCGAMRNETCKDTIAAGPVAVGPGAGVMYDLGQKLAFVGQVNTQLAFPNFTANVDVNVGVALKF